LNEKFAVHLMGREIR